MFCKTRAFEQLDCRIRAPWEKVACLMSYNATPSEQWTLPEKKQDEARLCPQHSDMAKKQARSSGLKSRENLRRPEHIFFASQAQNSQIPDK